MSHRIALIVLVAMMSCVRVAWAADPAGVATLKMAPKGVSLIAHVEGKPVGEMLQRLAKGLTGDKELLAEGSNIYKFFTSVADLATKIDSIDAYVGMDENGPKLLFAVRTKLTVEELAEQADKAMNAANPIPAAQIDVKAVKGDNGRYTISVGPATGAAAILQAVNGKDASDVKDDVILVGMNGMMDSMIATLNSGPNDALKELTKKADMSAPAWAIVVLPEIFKDAIPTKTIVISIYPDGKKPSASVITFATTRPAESLEQGFKTVITTTQPFSGSEKPFLSLVELKRNDAEITVAVTMDDKFIDSAVKAFKQARLLAKRAVSAANVNAICKGIVMYTTETPESVFPENLYALIGRGYASASAFVSPAKYRILKVDDKGIPTEEGDYIYIKPLSPNDDPTNVMIYEPLENWNGEGTVVAYIDGTVRWMSAEDFKKALKKTMDNRAKDKK